MITTTLETTQLVTSYDIAKLTGKRHSNILRDIRKLITDLHGENEVVKYQHIRISQNKGLPFFKLPKHESILLCSGYGPTFGDKMINYWEKVETNIPVNTTSKTSPATNLATIANTGLTMSSLEIAELTGKLHSHVLRDIREMISTIHELKDDPNLDHVDILGISILKDNRGYIANINLDKDHTLTLLTGYDAKARFNVVKRWQELEAKLATPQPATIDTLNNPVELRGLLLTYVEKVIELQEENKVLEAKTETLTSENTNLSNKVQTLSPKAKALDKIAVSDGEFNLTNTAKVLQVQPKKFMDYLRQNKWIYRRPGASGNVAYQDKIQSGLLCHKVITIQSSDGTDKTVQQVMVTSRGLEHLSRIFSVSTADGFDFTGDTLL